MLTLPPLPYAHDALEPAISSTTLREHHGAHHAAYVEKTNKLAKAAGLDDKPLEHIIREARRKSDSALFNQAAQAWNHAFYWRSLAPPGSAAISADMRNVIADQFGGFDAFRAKFLELGESHFGSGWLWLVSNRDGALALSPMHDAETPADDPNVRPLIVCDLWEHAYYLDRRSKRRAYLEAVFDELLNWPFAAQERAAALKGEERWRHPEPAANLHA